MLQTVNIFKKTNIFLNKDKSDINRSKNKLIFGEIANSNKIVNFFFKNTCKICIRNTNSSQENRIEVLTAVTYRPREPAQDRERRRQQTLMVGSLMDAMGTSGLLQTRHGSDSR